MIVGIGVFGRKHFLSSISAITREDQIVPRNSCYLAKIGLSFRTLRAKHPCSAPTFPPPFSPNSARFEYFLPHPKLRVLKHFAT
jgi:hypothetical protein